MARLAMVVKTKRTILTAQKSNLGRDKIRVHFRCGICGRPRGYMRKFGICRLCFRSMALSGKIPGIIKASW